MAAMIFRVSPQHGHWSMSISNTRFNRRAQLMRTEVEECGASSFASDGLLLPFFSPEIISARNLALGASTA
jgi:hypothetical protein